MNAKITTLERPSTHLRTSPVLAQNGYTGTLLTLEPGAETMLASAHAGDDQLLFVVEGRINVSSDEVTTMVSRDGTALLSGGESPLVANPGTSTARVLRVEIPARRVVTPQILTPRT